MHNISHTLIHPQYEILELIGSGGMGHVYMARHNKLNRLVAIKTLNAGIVASESRSRFIREGRSMSALRHRNIAAFYEFGFGAENVPYIAMELVQGVSLERYLIEKGRLDVPEAAQIMQQVCQALLHAHSHSIIHRDLKPSNIMLVEEGGRRLVKLIDFGLSKAISGTARDIQSLTAEGTAVGTVLYMSPEQCMGLAVDHRADIYSIGCILYQCMTGLPPFTALHTVELMQQQIQSEPPLEASFNGMTLPPAVRDLIARAMAKLPDERYQSAEEMISDLQALSRGSTDEVSRGVTLTSKRRRNLQPLSALSNRYLVTAYISLAIILMIAAVSIRCGTVGTGENASSTTMLNEVRHRHQGITSEAKPAELSQMIGVLKRTLEANERDRLLDPVSEAWVHSKLAHDYTFCNQRWMHDGYGIPRDQSLLILAEIEKAAALYERANSAWTTELYVAVEMVSESGNFDVDSVEAVERLQSLITANRPAERSIPNQIRCLCSTAKMLIDLRKFDSAIKLIGQAKKLNRHTEMEEAYIATAEMQLHIAQNDPEKAIRVGQTFKNNGLRNLNLAKELCRAGFYRNNYSAVDSAIEMISDILGQKTCFEPGLNALIFAKESKINGSLKEEQQLVRVTTDKPFMLVHYRAESDLDTLEKYLAAHGHTKQAARIHSDLIQVRTQVRRLFENMKTGVRGFSPPTSTND